MNTGGPDLDTVLKNQNITVEDSILDICCGKGDALLTMKYINFLD
jgi:ubiquinone/menaquinone biosynthesis C-methylase UbiE